jgi:hypothetical protein
MAANRRRLEHGLQAGDLEDLPVSGDNYTPWKNKAWQDLTRPDTSVSLIVYASDSASVYASVNVA